MRTCCCKAVDVPDFRCTVAAGRRQPAGAAGDSLGGTALDASFLEFSRAAEFFLVFAGPVEGPLFEYSNATPATQAKIAAAPRRGRPINDRPRLHHKEFSQGRRLTRTRRSHLPCRDISGLLRFASAFRARPLALHLPHPHCPRWQAYQLHPPMS